MPLAVEKSAVLYYGRHNSEHVYTIQGSILQSTDSTRDIGVTRSVESGFNQHITGVVSSASRVTGALSRIFQQRPATIPWLAFKSCVLSILMHASPVWSPTNAWKKAALEGVIRRFTKRLSGLGQLSWAERLSTENVFSLEDMRTCADMSAMYKFVHDHAGGLSAIRQTVMSGVTRSAGLQLFQKRLSNNAAVCLFRFRAARQ